MTYTYRTTRDASILEKLWRVHWPLIAVICLLAAVGTLALYSVAGGSFQPWAERHALRFLVALALVLAMAVVSIDVWLRLAYPVYAVAFLLLLLVPLVGVEAMGARRWIGIGPVQFQPSELMKLGLIMALARYYQWLPANRVSWPRYVAIPLVLIAAPVLLTLRQPDLGSAALFAILGLSLMYFAGVSIFYFVASLTGVVALMPMLWSGLHDYQRRRIEIFLDPDKDPLGAGYHITQSKIALGSGGISGKGFLQGTQSQLDFVPEQHTDFIASMIGEEWGFAGLIALLALYAVLIAILFIMAWRCRNRFSRLLILGSAMTFFVYVFINMAMITGLVPVVGVPLPLVSYGGTAMATVMLGLGLAMSGYVHGHHVIREGDLKMWL